MRNFSGTIAFIICFIIGCMFLYWAVEYWVYNSFDSNRYELSKIQVANSDSLSTWVLDKRTGNLQYCTKSYDRMDHFVCVKSLVIEAKDYSDTPEPIKTLKEPAKTVPANSTPPTDTPPMTQQQPFDTSKPVPAATAPTTVTDATAPMDATAPAMDATSPAAQATEPAAKTSKKKSKKK